MADKELSEITAASALDGTETIHVVQSGNSRRATLSDFETQAFEGTAKSWLNFDGTGTISTRDSFNISSVTDNGTGDYAPSFSNNFANANYNAVASVNALGSATNDNNSAMVFARSSATNTTPTTSGMSCCAFHADNSVNQDVSRYLLTNHGDLA